MHMKALISSIEPRENGYRVAQVEPDDNVFPVAEGMFWVDCPEDMTADSKWFDPADSSFKEFPFVAQVTPARVQPTANGAQTL